MDNPDLENRICKIEWTIGRQNDNIKELFDTSEELRTTLCGIHQTLVQIKWFAIGVSCLFMADQFGLTAVIKLLG